MASKLIIPLYVDRVGKMLKRTGFSEYYSANTKINLKRGTSYRFHVFFVENDHVTPYSLDAGALVRISMRREGVFDGNNGVLVSGESLADPEAVGDPYVIDLTLNTVEIDDYLGVNGTAGDDVVSANVEFGISWTEDGWDTKQENNDRVLGFLVNDVNKQGDGTPTQQPSPETWLSLRAVRFDIVQSLTQPQKDQALANLGMPVDNYFGTAAPTPSDGELAGYSVGSKWYDSVAKEAYFCVDATQDAAVWELLTLSADDLGSAAFLNATNDGDANPDEVLKTDADGGVTVTSLALRKLALHTTDPVDPTEIGESAWSVDEEVPFALLKDGVKLHYGSDVLYHVENVSGEVLPKGTPVAYAGTVGNSGKLRVTLWNGGLPAKAFMGFTMSDIATETTGFVQHFGAIRGIDTSGANSQSWADGDILYAVQDYPWLTNVQPSSGGYASVAVVINAHASNGTLFVRPTVVPTADEIGGVTESDLSYYPQTGMLPVWVNAYKIQLSAFPLADGVYHRESLDYNGKPQYQNVRSNNSWIRWNGSQWELYDNLGQLAVVAISPVDSPDVPTTGWYADGGTITVELFATIHGLGEAAFFDVDRSGSSIENFKLVRCSDSRLSDVTNATASETANTLVRRGSFGEAAFGSSTDFSGFGVLGLSNSGAGVEGISASGTGIYGYSASGNAFYGVSLTGLNHAQFGNSGNNRSFIRRVLGLFGWNRGNFTQVFGSPDTLTAHRDVRLPDASGTVALTSDLNSYAKLSGGNIVIGNQTITGQVEIVGQANNTPNSALTTLLGRLDPLNVMEYQIYPQIAGTSGVSTTATGDGSNNSTVITPISINSGNNTGAGMLMRVARYISQNVGGNLGTVNFGQKMLLTVYMRSARRSTSGIAYISWPMLFNATTGLLSDKGFGWKQANGFIYGVTHDGTTLRETTGFADTLGFGYNLVIYNDGLGNYSFYVNGTLIGTLAGATGTASFVTTDVCLVMQVINPVGGSDNSIALSIQNLTMKSWL